MSVQAVISIDKAGYKRLLAPIDPAMAARSSTDHVLNPWEVANAHDVADDNPWEPASSDSDDFEEPDPLKDPTAACEMWLNEMLQLYMSSNMSAMHFCILCYWASLGGMDHDRVRAYGLPPGRPTGHYQRHLNPLLGFDESGATLYYLTCPAQLRHEAGQELQVLPGVWCRAEPPGS